MNGIAELTSGDTPIERVPPRLLTVNMMRAVGAITVYLSHVISLSALPLAIPTVVQGIGVEIFYFVSGFIITLVLLKTPHWSGRKFLKRRLLRILPAYYVSILIIVGLINSAFLLSPQGLMIILQHLVMLQGFNSGYRGAINGAYWMLGNIVWFYVVVALVGSWLRTRWFGALLLVGFLLCYGWRTAVFGLGSTLNPLLQQVWETQLPGVLDIYLIGMVVAWLYHQRGMKAVPEQFPFWSAWVAIISGILLAGLGILLRNGATTSLLYFVLWRTFFGIGVGSIVLGCLGFENSPWFAKFVHYSGLNALSRISYSVFLYHLPVILSFNHFVGGAATVNPWVLFGIMTGAVLLVATGSYHLVEQRAIHLNLIPLFQWRRAYPHEHARQDQ